MQIEQQETVFERQGDVAVPVTGYLPKVTGGVCEFCGIIDNKQPSEVQYTLCPHYKGKGLLRCTYCDATKNPIDVIKQSTINVHRNPDNPNKLTTVCDSFECSQKHLARFKISA